MARKIKAVGFDFDGTLISSEKEKAKEMGLVFKEKFKIMKGVETAYKRLRGNNREAKVKSLFKTFLKREPKKTELKAILTAIITNVVLLLAYFGIIIPADLIPIIIGMLIMLISSFVNPAKAYNVDTQTAMRSIGTIGSWVFWLGLAVAILSTILQYIS